MELRYITQPFALGVPTEIPVGGRYAIVLAAPNDFTLEVGQNGQYTARALQTTVGDEVDCKTGEPGFDALRITAAGNDVISILVTDGQFRRTGRISDVTDRASRVLGTLAGAAHANNAKTAGAASAALLAANAARKYLAIQNQDATQSVYVRTDGGAAVADNTSVKIAPGQTWEPPVPPVGAVNAIRGGASDVLLQVVEA